MSQSEYAKILIDRPRLRKIISGLKSRGKIPGDEWLAKQVNYFKSINKDIIRVTSSSCSEVSRPTLQRFLSGNDSDESGPLSNAQITLLFEYVLSRFPDDPDVVAIQHPNTAVFSEAARKQLNFIYTDIPSTPTDMPYIYGRYELVRPAWHSRSKNAFIRSELILDKDGSLSTMKETQAFELDDGKLYEENDAGILFGWKSCLVGNSSDGKQGVFKVWTFNAFMPEWPFRSVAVETIRGSLMALTDRGFVSSWPFFATRKDSSMIEPGGHDEDKLTPSHRDFFKGSRYPTLKELRKHG